MPILVGGSGERRTLRLVAQYADACNLFGDPAVVAHKVAVLAEHCAAVGRDPAAVSRHPPVDRARRARPGDLAALVERLPPGDPPEAYRAWATPARSRSTSAASASSAERASTRPS